MESRLAVDRTVKLHIECRMAECSHWFYVHDLEATATPLLPDTIEIIGSHVPVMHTLSGVAAMTQRAHLAG